MTKYVTCLNCGQLTPCWKIYCPSCKKEWYLDYSKCKHRDLNELEVNIFQTANSMIKRSEAFCRHCCNEIPLTCDAVLGLDDKAVFNKPNGEILVVKIKR